MFKKHRLLIGGVALLSFVAVACSSPSKDDGGSDNSGSGDSTAASAAAKALGIDLTKCPTDPTKKFGAEVNVGNTIPQTGPVGAALGIIGPALKVAFDNDNATYGLSTKLKLITEDDAFTPDKALTSTQTLLDKDKIDLMTTVIATAQVAAVRGVLGEDCVPLISGISGGSSANDPTRYPFTTVFSQPFALDARIWLADATANHPSGAKIAVLYSNTESGKDYLAAIKKYAGTNKIVATQSIEATDTGAPSSQITTLRASGADVLLAAPTAAQCASTMKEVASQGWKPDFYLTSSCSSGTFDVAGSAADNVKINTYFMDPTRGKYANDPDVLAAVALLKKGAPSIPINNTSFGAFNYAQVIFEAAKAAQASPLGLSRLGMIQAATHLDFQPKFTLPGVKFHLDGLKDQVAIEASMLAKYTSSSKQFTDIKLYDFEGQMTGQ
jgi:branched-chain amino acid transport system substrate-binding protein